MRSRMVGGSGETVIRARRRSLALSTVSALTLGLFLQSGSSMAACVEIPSSGSVVCEGVSSLSGVTISTSADFDRSVLADVGAELSITGSEITSSGEESPAVEIGEDASVTIDADTNVRATGVGASAVRSADFGFAAGSRVVVDGTVSAEGENFFGFDMAGILLGDRSSVSVSGEVGALEDDVLGVLVGQGSTVEVLLGGRVVTSGERSDAIAAGSGSTVTVGGDVETSGGSSAGVNVFESDVVIGSGGSILTRGESSSGIAAGGSGLVTVDGDIRTEGGFAFGVGAFDLQAIEATSVILGTSGSIATSGFAANGIDVYRFAVEGDTSIDVGGRIETSGDVANGVFVRNATEGSVDISVGGSIVSSGEAASGIFVASDLGSSLSIDVDGSIRASGNGILVSPQGGLILEPLAQPVLLRLAAPSPAWTVITIGEGGSVEGGAEAILVEESFYGARVGTDLTIAGRVATTSEIGPSVRLASGDDVVTLLPTYSVDGAVDAGEGYDELRLDGAVGTEGVLDFASSSPFISFETLRKEGGGLWDLVGTGWEAPGMVEIADGTLRLGTDIATSDIFVAEAGLLSGSGRFGSLNVDGRVSPGAMAGAIDTIDVDGDLVLGSGSEFVVDLSAAGRSDLLRVGGLTTLQGGRLSPIALDPWGQYREGSVYTVLTSEGGVTGTFAPVAPASIFLRFEESYLEDRVLLTTRISPPVVEPEPPVVDPEPEPQPPVVEPEPPVIEPEPPVVVPEPEPEPPVVEPQPEPEPPVTQPEPPVVEPSPEPLPPVTGPVFMPAGETRNQRAAASGLDTLATDAGSDSLYVYNQVLFSPTLEAARRAFDLSSGEIHATVQTVMARSGRQFLSTVIDEAGRSGREGAVNPANTFWSHVEGFEATIDGDGNAAEANVDGGSVILGGDLYARELADGGVFIGGVALGYGKADVDIADRLSGADISSYSAALHSRVHSGSWTFSSAVSYAAHEIETERRIRFGAIDRTTSADYDAQSYGASGRVSYRFGDASGFVDPYVSGGAWSVKTDAARESGAGALDLVVGKASHDIADLGIGAAFGRTVSFGGIEVSALLDVSYRHGIGDAPSRVQSFAGGTRPFTVFGLQDDGSRIDLGTGFDVAVTPSLSIGLRYDGTFGEKSDGHSAQARLGYRF